MIIIMILKNLRNLSYPHKFIEKFSYPLRTLIPPSLKMEDPLYHLFFHDCRSNCTSMVRCATWKISVRRLQAAHRCGWIPSWNYFWTIKEFRCWMSWSSSKLTLLVTMRCDKAIWKRKRSLWSDTHCSFVREVCHRKCERKPGNYSFKF